MRSTTFRCRPARTTSPCRRRRLPEHGDQERRQPVGRPRDGRLGRHADRERQYRREPAEVRFPAEHELRGLRVGRQLQRGRPAHRQQAARVRIAARLARARERAGGVLDDRARSDEHRLGTDQPHVSAQPEQQDHRLLLVSGVHQAEPVPERADHHAGEGFDERRGGPLQRVPVAVEHDSDQELLRRRASWLQHDPVPDLPSTARRSRSPTTRPATSRATTRRTPSATVRACR